MTSKEKINSIKCVINEFYHDMNCKGKLTECANECWKEYQQFCEDIKQDLERLEELEKELKQTKLNFRNSQTHSKNCYKKLKKENVELKKVIKKIKLLPNCEECDSNWHKGCMCLQRKIKEVLENDK